MALGGCDEADYLYPDSAEKIVDRKTKDIDSKTAALFEHYYAQIVEISNGYGNFTFVFSQIALCHLNFLYF